MSALILMIVSLSLGSLIGAFISYEVNKQKLLSRAKEEYDFIQSLELNQEDYYKEKRELEEYSYREEMNDNSLNNKLAD